ncbi:MAG TPA: hypothetical protein PKH78_08195 [Candidatus Obscuribacter sp.]|nr:hypothetical protein [Candidatus Obscuribacter sp.]
MRAIDPLHTTVQPLPQSRIIPTDTSFQSLTVNFYQSPDKHQMKFLGLVIAFSAITQSICQAQASPQKTARGDSAKVTCLELHQKSRTYGNVRVLINDYYLKISQTDGSTIILSKAPDWDLYCINRLTHTYARSERSKPSPFLGQTVAAMEGVDFSKVRWKVFEKGKIAQLNASHLVDAGVANPARYENSGYQNLENELKERGFWVSEEKLCLAQPANHLSTLVLLPKTDRIPLRYFHRSPGGSKCLVLETLASKKVQVDRSEFALPKGYKQTKSEFDGGLSETGVMDILKGQ